MAQTIRIALDAMGGDFGPKVTIAGAANALERRPDSRFLLIGDETAIRAELAAHPRLAGCADGAPFRRSRSAWTTSRARRCATAAGSPRCGMAIEAVKKGEADVAVSAGNTGALMAMAKICLRTMARVDRPALACLWPTLRG